MAKNLKTKKTANSNVAAWGLGLVVLAGLVYFSYNYLVSSGSPKETVDSDITPAVSGQDLAGEGDKEWQKYSSAQKGYSLEYPLGWDIDSAADLFKSGDYQTGSEGAKVMIEIATVGEGKTWQEQAREGIITLGEEEVMAGRQVLQETVSGSNNDYMEIVVFPSADQRQVATVSLHTIGARASDYREIFNKMISSFIFLADDGENGEQKNENADSDKSIGGPDNAGKIYENEKYGYSLTYPNDWKTYEISSERVGFLPLVNEPTPQYIGDITVSYTYNVNNLSMEEYYNGRNDVNLFGDAAGGVADFSAGGIAGKIFRDVMGYVQSTIVVLPVEGGFIEISDNNNKHQEDGIFNSLVISFSS